MKTLRVWMTALAVAAAAGAPAWAADQSTATTPSTTTPSGVPESAPATTSPMSSPAATADLAAPTSVKEISGTVAAVDPRSNTVTVRELAGAAAPTSSSMNFVIDDKTNIMENGKALKLKEVKVGRAVKIGYQTDGRQHLARSISLLPGAAR